MAKKTGLGDKFNDLFDDGSALFGNEPESSLSEMKITDIEPNKNQPRKKFDDEALKALADSIAENGVIQPLTVRPMSNGSYQLVAGERRWRAAKIAGLTEVPVRIMELSDEQTAQVALIENLQREDLNAVEEAEGYKSLIETYGMTQESVAKKVGKARSSVANALRILELPDEIKLYVSRKQLTQGHCKALLPLAGDKQAMILTARRAVKSELSVRALEAAVNAQIKGKAKSREKTKPAFLTEAELSFRETVGKPCKIVPKRGKLTVMIDVKDENELKELLHRVTGE